MIKTSVKLGKKFSKMKRVYYPTEEVSKKLKCFCEIIEINKILPKESKKNSFTLVRVVTWRTLIFLITNV